MLSQVIQLKSFSSLIEGNCWDLISFIMGSTKQSWGGCALRTSSATLSPPSLPISLCQERRDIYTLASFLPGGSISVFSSQFLCQMFYFLCLFFLCYHFHLPDVLFSLFAFPLLSFSSLFKLLPTPGNLRPAASVWISSSGVECRSRGVECGL